MRINPGMKPKEPTYQVALDALALTTCYHAFLITAEVPVIYMYQDILNICPKVPGKAFDEPPTEEEALSFIRELGHIGEIKYITYVIVNHPHQPWRTFAAIINKCLCGKIYYAIALGAKPPISRKSQKKSDSAILSEKSPSKKKSARAKKFAAPKPKPTKKKTPVKANRGKGLNVLSEVALSEAAQLTEATKRSKKYFHISQESVSGDGTNFESGVPDEQHLKITGADEGTCIIPGVLNVPKYDYKSEKESWGNSGEEDEDDENDYEDKSDDGDDNDNGNDGNDDNDDDDDNQEEEEEKINDEETMDDEEDDKVTKELYKDVNVNLGNKDTEMTNADQGGPEQQNVSQESGFEQVKEDAHVTLTPVLDTQKADEPVQSSSVSSDFTSKLLNLENPSPANNEIASLMETSARHATAVSEITSGFTTTIPLLPLFFNPYPQQATPTPTPTTSEATTAFPSLLDFSSVFKFNDRVTNLEKDLLEIKQVDQCAQALSSIHAIVDRYIDNKLGEAINKAIQAHNLDCRQEAQDEKNEYIGLIDTSRRTIIKEEVITQLPQILPLSTYEAAAALSEFELTKMLIDKIEKNKSYDKAAYKRELYEALVKSYKTDKDLFDSYGKVFTLKRSKDDKDKDQDPSAGSDRGTKRRKSSKEAESSKDSRSKEKKSSSTSKDASQSQHKSTHAEEPSHNVEDAGVQQDQEFVTRDNDEQPDVKEVSKDDWFKKPEQPPTPDFDWNKRQHLMDTSFDFTAFVLNRLNIKDLTQEILVGPAFELLKGTWKSLTKLEYHLEECSKAITEQLNWHNLEGKPYLFDLSKPLPLLQDHRGRQKLYKFREGDFLRLRLQDIEDMLLLLVQQKLTDLKIDERLNLRNKTTYTAYSDPKGVIYKDQNIRNRLMRADELHKFNDGTLNDAQTVLHDIAKGIRMEYLPKRKWSGLHKRRVRVMVQDIDKQLYKRRLM
ncbi:hypothetical protein Tco_1225952 [Tanacetum coccineum]